MNNTTFAGFKYPKYQWTLPKEPIHQRLEHFKKHHRLHPYTGCYRQNEPHPLPHKGWNIYHTPEFMPERWEWADEIVCARIRHTGWWVDDYQEDKIRGFIVRLNHGRGFLAGWSMGEGMVAELDPYIYDDVDDAAHAADSWAEQVALNEREYQEELEEN